MSTFLIYLLKVNISLILFCLAYYGILRRMTFYNLNRFFLLAGIAFSSIYPLIDFSSLFADDVLVIPVDKAITIIYQPFTGLDYDQVLRIVFWGGAALMAIRMGMRFFSLYRIHRRSVPQRIINYPVRVLEGEISTFSFWQNIYLNPAQHQPEELAAVLEHEHVHVKEWHTLDILLAELTTVFYWFNPGVWYMRRAVKENVEFITDQRILQKGVDRKAYQYSMINAVGSLQPSVLMNNFNLTAIKLRIIMMNSKRTSSVHLFRYVLLVPVLVCVTCAFTLIKTHKDEQPAPKKKHATTQPKGFKITIVRPETPPPAKRPVTKRPQTSAMTKENSQPMTIAFVRNTGDSVINVGQDTEKEVVVAGHRKEETGAKTNTVDGVLIKRVEGFRLEGKDTEGQPMPALKGKVTGGVVVVKGIPVEDRSLTDQLMKDGSIKKFYINDKEATREDMKSLNAASIVKVVVGNQKTGDKEGLYLYTK